MCARVMTSYGPLAVFVHVLATDMALGTTKPLSHPLCVSLDTIRACANTASAGTVILELSRSAGSSSWHTILTSSGIVAEHELRPWLTAKLASSRGIVLMANHAASTATIVITALLELDERFNGTVNATVSAVFAAATRHDLRSEDPAGGPSPPKCRPDARGNTGLHNLELQLDFAAHAGMPATTPLRWMPNLHRAQCKPTPCHSNFNKVYESDRASNTNDHFFRSPAIIGAANGAGFVLVPDLDVIAAQQRDGVRSLPHSLDLHAVNDTVMSAWAGVASSSIQPHMYSVRDNSTTLLTLAAGRAIFSTTIMVEFYRKRNDLLDKANSYLWQRYGRVYLADIRPQVST